MMLIIEYVLRKKIDKIQYFLFNIYIKSTVIFRWGLPIQVLSFSFISKNFEFKNQIFSLRYNFMIFSFIQVKKKLIIKMLSDDNWTKKYGLWTNLK